jgi:hypothetical protein
MWQDFEQSYKAGANGLTKKASETERFPEKAEIACLF